MSQESRSKELADGLIEHIGGFQATVTGFSAGVDSTVVAVAAAHRVVAAGAAEGVGKRPPDHDRVPSGIRLLRSQR